MKLRRCTNDAYASSVPSLELQLVNEGYLQIVQIAYTQCYCFETVRGLLSRLRAATDTT